MHTLLDSDGILPEFLEMTDGKVHDATVAKKLRIPPGSYLAIDRAYHDFEQYNIYNNNNIRFVTRKKTNAKYVVIKSRKVDRTKGIISDEIVEFTGHQTYKKYPHPLRIIRFFDKESEKELEFLTNDFDLEAITITQIYKARWEIELFFKTIKQNLKIKRFIGNSPNAVWTQIWIAMIAYLLVSYLKFIYRSNMSVQKLFQRIQVNLFERKPINEIIQNIKYKPPNSSELNQFGLFQSLTGH
jgi:putative transposase